MQAQSVISGLDIILILILLTLMFFPLVSAVLLVVWLLKKGYNLMNQNNERYCYIAYRHNQTNQVFDSGIQLESEIDTHENNVINAGHSVLIRYNSKELDKLKGWIETFRKENNVVC